MVTGSRIYPNRPDLADKPMWACLPCRAWTGCHPGTEKRVGRLANAATRRLRMAAHDALDPLWKSGRMKRKEVYAWLGEELGLAKHDCHVGWMTDDDLRRTAILCHRAMGTPAP